ncbi:Gfo/Idh/MocA family protein [Gracilibacillus kekensis]|uniref:Predicted dehydrogenase n=1 Tax=Gracilibacillus kekensis TaxID=1027249 RepID=A0A1M7QTG6_9BACI|nr:Gfo/Idh/MocA family oxidoreductase [Gracilibacillus kekensis]SHN35032.1 Predicted dehydrogenase [Gracilibacillus kekensis]
MRKRNKINVGIVGLQFGGQFAPIYKLHPNIGEVAICDTNKQLLQNYGDKFNFERRYSSLDDLLEEDDIDAIHLVTSIHSHATQSIQVLNSGKHCACTVPMATTIEELNAIVAAQQTSGKNYMMMETAVYTHQYLYAQEAYKHGELGAIQFLRGAHYQDMENWPPYWKGLPPMHYSTHAIAPLLSISDAKAVKVHAFGSGTMREELQQQYGNPYPIETAIFQLDRKCLSAEVTRSLFETARSYMESFNIYGKKASLEWHLENEPLVRFEMENKIEGRGRVSTYSKVVTENRSETLPSEISHFMTKQEHLDEDNPHLSVLQGGAHHGSHPHLVHEFVSSIIENRLPKIDAVTAANWTAAGICAHDSAMQGGKEITIPTFNK